MCAAAIWAPGKKTGIGFAFPAVSVLDAGFAVPPFNTFAYDRFGLPADDNRILKRAFGE